MRNESGATKIQVFSTRKLKIHASRVKFELVLIKNDEEAFTFKGGRFPLQNP